MFNNNTRVIFKKLCLCRGCGKGRIQAEIFYHHCILAKKSKYISSIVVFSVWYRILFHELIIYAGFVILLKETNHQSCLQLIRLRQRWIEISSRFEIRGKSGNWMQRMQVHQRRMPQDQVGLVLFFIETKTMSCIRLYSKFSMVLLSILLK